MFDKTKQELDALLGRELCFKVLHVAIAAVVAIAILVAIGMSKAEAASPGMRVDSPEQCAVVADLVITQAAFRKHKVPAKMQAALMESLYENTFATGGAAWRAIAAAVAVFVAKPQFADSSPVDLATAVGSLCMQTGGDLSMLGPKGTGV